METFVVVTASDERVQVPFRVPAEGDDITFTIPRLNYLDEASARKMKQNLLDLDKPVQQKDIASGELLWEKSEDGQDKLDADGNKIPLMGSPQLTTHESLRAVSEAMLSALVPAAVFKRLQRLTVGELDQIITHWTKLSSAPLDGEEGAEPGESSASSTS